MRASRLLAILILLQVRRHLTAEALAHEFEVSVRTIYRDIDALSAAGVPVYGDRGPGGGFQLHEGYQTRLTGLDAGEAEALLMIGLPDLASALGLGEATRAARGKLLAAVRPDRSDAAQRLAGRIHVDTVDWYRSAAPAPGLDLLARAVLDQRRIAMRYASWTRERDWTADPLGLVAKAGRWYLVARTGERIGTFSVESVKALSILPEGFERPADFTLADWWRASLADFEARLRPLTARLRVSSIGLSRIAALGRYAEEAVAASLSIGEGWHALDLPFESAEQAALLILGLGAEVDVVEPVALSRAVRCEALRIARRMRV